MTLGEMLNMPFPVNSTTWQQACKLVRNDDRLRMDNLSACALQDCVIALELLRSANGMDVAPKEGHVKTVKAAALRLGTEAMLDALYRLGSRREFKNAAVMEKLEHFRYKGRRASYIARLLAGFVVPKLASEVQTAACMLPVGDMLAVACFQEDYLELAAANSRAKLNYKLVQLHRFDVEAMRLRYLELAGLPADLLFALDRAAESDSPERTLTRPVCLAAEEVVQLFDADRWERLHPDNTLAPKSPLRSLMLNRRDYKRFFDAAAEYLFGLNPKPTVQGGAEQEKQSETGAADEEDDQGSENEQAMPTPQAEAPAELLESAPAAPPPVDSPAPLVLQLSGDDGPARGECTPQAVEAGAPAPAQCELQCGPVFHACESLPELEKLAARVFQLETDAKNCGEASPLQRIHDDHEVQQLLEALTHYTWQSYDSYSFVGSLLAQAYPQAALTWPVLPVLPPSPRDFTNDADYQMMVLKAVLEQTPSPELMNQIENTVERLCAVGTSHTHKPADPAASGASVISALQSRGASRLLLFTTLVPPDSENGAAKHHELHFAVALTPTRDAADLWLIERPRASRRPGLNLLTKVIGEWQAACLRSQLPPLRVTTFGGALPSLLCGSFGDLDSGTCP
jgi:hypothetical protein